MAKRNTFNVDEELDAPFDWSHLKRSLGYMARYKKNFLLVLLVTIAGMILGLSIPLLTELVVDEYIPAGNINGILWLGGAMLVMIVVIVLCNRVKNRLNSVTGQGIVHDIRDDVYTHLQELPFDYFDSRPAGKILVRVINYINSVADFLASGLITFVLELLSMVVIVFFMLSVSPKLTLVVVSGLPLFAIYVFIMKPIQRKAWQYYNNKQSNLTAYLAENINGVKITQAFSREGFNEDIYESLLKENRKAFMKAVFIIHSLWPITVIVAKLVVAALYVVAIYYLRDEVTPGKLMAMAGFAWRFWGPVQNLGNVYNNLVSTVSYLERIFQVLDEKVTVKDQPGVYELPRINGNVTFLDVDFAYDPETPVLNKVTFEAMAGESIALVGPTGAGKSTVINLLSRFYNIGGGAVYVDGHDIQEVSLTSLRSQMGVMLQDTFIFSGNIMENIRYGRLNATDEECIAAAKLVKADEFISKLPDGYYTVVHERGEGFSAGQKQLLSFARTVLSDPRILILDEATSSIDTQTERLVQEGIAALLKGRTSFIVAHRLSTIQDCTRILYISGGKIAETGSHEELLARKGLYYELYMSQIG